MFVLYDSPLWSGIFLLVIFAVSVWNGGGFYIEVFGRKYVVLFPSICQARLMLTSSSHLRFERELEELRKELAEATAMRPSVSSASGRTSPAHSDIEASSNDSPEVAAVEGDPHPDIISLDSTSSHSLLFTSQSLTTEAKKKQ